MWIGEGVVAEVVWGDCAGGGLNRNGLVLLVVLQGWVVYGLDVLGEFC